MKLVVNFHNLKEPNSLNSCNYDAHIEFLVLAGEICSHSLKCNGKSPDEWKSCLSNLPELFATASINVREMMGTCSFFSMIKGSKIRSSAQTSLSELNDQEAGCIRRDAPGHGRTKPLVEALDSL